MFNKIVIATGLLAVSSLALAGQTTYNNPKVATVDGSYLSFTVEPGTTEAWCRSKGHAYGWVAGGKMLQQGFYATYDNWGYGWWWTENKDAGVGPNVYVVTTAVCVD
ncbi:hypothetical protein [Agaribacterium sp. ZY112]|uniref:hypothetical protein n=1 Tax=Agaribacterium sp. ZY112 TaxID=3233574 RepID=UPI003523EA06